MNSQSHHTGIEIYDGVNDVFTAEGSQSHHTGIEIEDCCIGRTEMSYSQSHHTGIEIDILCSVMVSHSQLSIAPYWN